MTTNDISQVIVAGTPNDIALMLNELPDINEALAGADGHTVLHIAVLTGEVEKVKVILERRPHLEPLTSNKKYTPLHTAVIYDQGAVIEALLDAGANIEATAQNGLTSLHLAAMKGHAGATSVLLRRGASVHTTEVNGATALHGAAYYGFMEVVRLLLENGADPDRKDQKGLCPRIIAANKGHSAILSLMGGPNKAAGIAILTAARNGDLEKVKALLKDKADLVSSKDNEAFTPLHMAAGQGHTAVVELLLSFESDVNGKDNEGYTPLHFAASEGQKEVAKLLLANKADVNARNSSGESPLHHAAEKGHQELVALLLANQAEVNSKNNFGTTPLQRAGHLGHKAVLELLRRHGAHE